MGFIVTKLAPTLVAPYEPTPSGNLPLSFMDRLPASRFLVDSIHVFKNGQQPAMVIRDALSKALVSYYPVAGKLAMSDQGELEVVCTSWDGVWFVEASVDRSLEDVNHLELPLAVPKEELLPYLSPEVEKDLSVLMQVTQFKCGGFVVGMRSSHAMFDGLGAAQFVQAIGDMARGLAQPTIKPIWCREGIPSPPKLPSLRPPPSLAAHPFVTFLLDISLDRISEIKSKFTEETGRYCSKFDILTAKVWQSRARAIRLDPPGAEVRLGFAANARHLLHQLPPQEGGYYGNCAYAMTITAPREKITDSSLFGVINLIRKAKENLSTKFSKWLMGDPEEDPFKVPVDYGLLCVSDWSRVGFNEVDYGWGRPIHVGPLDDNNFIASCIFLRPPAPKQGVRLIARCVVEEQSRAFQDQMVNLV